MKKEPWIFVRDVGLKMGNWHAFVWCRDNLLLNDWDHTTEGYWFKNEQDAIMFTLKWI